MADAGADRSITGHLPFLRRLIASPGPHERAGDRAFRWLVLAFGGVVVGLTLALAVELGMSSRLAWHAFGLRFLWTSVWDPVQESFGALPFIWGTLVTSAIAMAIAVPLGLGSAIFLAELAPRRISDACAFLIELLAAIPTVIMGLLGIFILAPLMRRLGAPYGVGVLTAGILLAFIIVPYITSIAREVMLTVPRSLKEACLALGATRWEMVRMVVLPYARSGILGALFLALGRALGETMAVTMVIGNRPEISAAIWQPGYTMAAVIANEFTEATSDLHVHTLVLVGLVLFGITMVVNGVARLMIHRLGAGGGTA